MAKSHHSLSSRLRFTATGLALLLLPLVLAACEVLKSSNPLSPLLAGPIAGVTIAAPTQVAPQNGGTILDKDQPVSLVIQNPASNSPRPVSLRLQIAADSGFAGIIYSRDKLTPGDSGMTTYRLPDRLPSGRSYYWRVGAGDGADDSGWSPTARFDIPTPIVIGVPDPQQPVSNARVDSLTPEFTAANGVSSGPFGPLIYNFQIADNAQFAPIFANAEVPQGGGATKYVIPTLPAYDKAFYWRVRISDGPNTGNWSRTESFRTPLAPVVAPPPSGPGPSPVPTGDWRACGSLAADKLALVQCVHAAVNPGFGADQAFEVTKRVAWLLRGEGAGLLIKDGGENIVSWMGRSFAAGRICYPDGHIYKVLTDVGGGNGPGWADNDFVDKSLYVPAINPG